MPNPPRAQLFLVSPSIFPLRSCSKPGKQNKTPDLTVVLLATKKKKVCAYLQGRLWCYKWFLKFLLFNIDFYSRLRSWCYKLLSLFYILLLVRPRKLWLGQLC